MKSINDFPAPNIVPGLNLTAERFEEIFAWVNSLVADSVQAALVPHHFGLMMPFDSKCALQIEVSQEQLLLHRCFGISPGGSVFAVYEGTQSPIVEDLKKWDLRFEHRYYIMLQVLNHPRHAYGPESNDAPLRPLYSMPRYKIHLQSEEQGMTNLSDVFPIGRLSAKYGQWYLDEYIPPCLHIGASPALLEKYREYRENVDTLMDAFPKIIQQTDAYQSKAMVELREFSMQLGTSLAARRYAFMQLEHSSAPRQMFEFWAAFAEQIAFLLTSLTDRRGFFDLLNENTRGVSGVSFSPTQLDAAIDNLI